MLEIQDLTVCYHQTAVVDHVSFSVSEGQWLMIAGPNGAGKSTILNAVTQGAPYTGQVLFEGMDLKHMKAAQRARNIGMLAQDHYLSYGFTVEEIVELGRYAHSAGSLFSARPEDAGTVEEALELTGLTGLRHQTVTTLSGGELQRTFLAQVFAQNPRLLLLDEPTNHLDIIYQKQVFSMVQRWLETPGRAVVSVVHDLSLARAYGTHAVLLNKGQCVAFGPSEKVLSYENLDSVYGMDVAGWMRSLLSQWQE